MSQFIRISGTVNKSYKKFIIYNSLSNIICGIETTLSSYSMLKASGVGNEEVLSVFINLYSKDIIGQIFSAPIISKFSKIGDKNPKQHLYINSFIFSASNILEHLTPLLSSFYFIPVAALANIGKNIGFTGISSFNINMINKLSISKDNITEIYSKITTLSSINFSLGMILGICIVKIIPCYYTRLSLLPFLGISKYYLTLKSTKEIL